MKSSLNILIAVTVAASPLVGHAEQLDSFERDQVRKTNLLRERAAQQADIANFSALFSLYANGDKSVSTEQMVNEMLLVNPELLVGKMNMIPNILGDVQKLSSEERARITALQSALTNKAIEMNQSRDGRRMIITIASTVVGATVGTLTGIKKGAKPDFMPDFGGAIRGGAVGIVVGLIGGQLVGYGINSIVDKAQGHGNIEVKDLKILNE